MGQRFGQCVIAVLIAHAVAGAASAQNVDFSGAWMPLYHEDGPERRNRPRAPAPRRQST